MPTKLEKTTLLSGFTLIEYLRVLIYHTKKSCSSSEGADSTSPQQYHKKRSPCTFFVSDSNRPAPGLYCPGQSHSTDLFTRSALLFLEYSFVGLTVFLPPACVRHGKQFGPAAPPVPWCQSRPRRRKPGRGAALFNSRRQVSLRMTQVRARAMIRKVHVLKTTYSLLL